MRVIIAVDGSCIGNPGPGAWAAIMIYGQHRKELVGAEPATTNSRMELVAAIRGLQALKRPCEVELHTDSSYVAGVVSGRYACKTNLDLVGELRSLTRVHKVQVVRSEDDLVKRAHSLALAEARLCA